uniref:Uncharacterized protein n=1 Tax=Globodera rostochiensis TaxID=31243 RepID=A0A914H582_GLORO
MEEALTSFTAAGFQRALNYIGIGANEVKAVDGDGRTDSCGQQRFGGVCSFRGGQRWSAVSEQSIAVLILSVSVGLSSNLAFSLTFPPPPPSPPTHKVNATLRPSIPSPTTSKVHPVQNQMSFIDAPPPSYDQIDSHPPAGGDSIGYDLSEKVAEQSSVIRVQELEIGKLRRDLGRMKEQMERFEQRDEETQPPPGKATPIPPKLEQTLVQVVSEEVEERRRRRRSKKWDIIGGFVCFVALMAVLGLGIYIVLSKPPNSLINSVISDQQTIQNGGNSSKRATATTFSTTTTETATIVRQFRIIGKVDGDNLCWARAVLSSDQSHPRHCNVIRRSLGDPRLFCTFSLGNSAALSFGGTKGRFVLPMVPKGKAVILLKDQQRWRSSRKAFGTVHTHTLSLEEAVQRRQKASTRWGRTENGDSATAVLGTPVGKKSLTMNACHANELTDHQI